MSANASISALKRFPIIGRSMSPKNLSATPIDPDIPSALARVKFRGSPVSGFERDTSDCLKDTDMRSVEQKSITICRHGCQMGGDDGSITSQGGS